MVFSERERERDDAYSARREERDVQAFDQRNGTDSDELLSGTSGDYRKRRAGVMYLIQVLVNAKSRVLSCFVSKSVSYCSAVSMLHYRSVDLCYIFK